MAVSEAQKKSAQKWDAANLDRVSIAMPKGMKAMVKAAAAVAGESMNQYIIGATEQRMNGLQQPAGAPQGMGAILTPETLKTAQEAAQKAGETVSVFVARAVDVQAKRDNVTRAMRPKEKARMNPRLKKKGGGCCPRPLYGDYGTIYALPRPGALGRCLPLYFGQDFAREQRIGNPAALAACCRPFSGRWPLYHSPERIVRSSLRPHPRDCPNIRSCLRYAPV